MGFNPNAFKAARKRAGWGQVAYAAHIGVSPQTLRTWERGLARPSPMAQRLIDAMQPVAPQIKKAAPQPRPNPKVPPKPNGKTT